MAVAIYSLCALVALTCTFLLLRGYLRNRYRLLLWSGLCFAGLTVNNVFLFIDKIVLPQQDLSLLRAIPALLAMLVLVYGLVWESN